MSAIHYSQMLCQLSYGEANASCLLALPIRACRGSYPSMAMTSYGPCWRGGPVSSPQGGRPLRLGQRTRPGVPSAGGREAPEIAAAPAAAAAKCAGGALRSDADVEAGCVCYRSRAAAIASPPGADRERQRSRTKKARVGARVWVSTSARSLVRPRKAPQAGSLRACGRADMHACGPGIRTCCAQMSHAAARKCGRVLAHTSSELSSGIREHA